MMNEPTLRVRYVPHAYSERVTEEIASGDVISSASALAIASWWQAPRGYGLAFARFASTGTVDAEELCDAIDAEESQSPEGDELRALRRFVDVYRRDLRRIWYTADLTEPSGDDVSGWLSPDWSLWQLYDTRADVTADTYDADDDESPSAWLARTVTSRIGSVDGFDNAPTFYAADNVDNYRTGESVRLAAHAEGFTAEELDAAIALMRA